MCQQKHKEMFEKTDQQQLRVSAVFTAVRHSCKGNSIKISTAKKTKTFSTHKFKYYICKLHMHDLTDSPELFAHSQLI